MYDDPLKSLTPPLRRPSPALLVAGLVLDFLAAMLLVQGIGIVVADATDPHRLEHDGFGPLPGYFFIWVAVMLLACGVPFTSIGGYREYKYTKQIKQMKNMR